MPGAGGHRFEFVGKEPFVFLFVTTLLFVNTFLLFMLGFGAKYLLSKASLTLPPCEALAEGAFSITLQLLFVGTRAVQSPSSLSRPSTLFPAAAAGRVAACWTACPRRSTPR
jgi:hypothetical protein